MGPAGAAIRVRAAGVRAAVRRPEPARPRGPSERAERRCYPPHRPGDGHNVHAEVGRGRSAVGGIPGQSRFLREAGNGSAASAQRTRATRTCPRFSALYTAPCPRRHSGSSDSSAAMCARSCLHSTASHTSNGVSRYVPEHRNSSLRHRIPSDRTDGVAVTTRCHGNTPDNTGKTPSRKTAEAK